MLNHMHTPQSSWAGLLEDSYFVGKKLALEFALISMWGSASFSHVWDEWAYSWKGIWAGNGGVVANRARLAPREELKGNLSSEQMSISWMTEKARGACRWVRRKWRVATCYQLAGFSQQSHRSLAAGHKHSVLLYSALSPPWKRLVSVTLGLEEANFVIVSFYSAPLLTFPLLLSSGRKELALVIPNKTVKFLNAFSIYLRTPKFYGNRNSGNFC